MEIPAPSVQALNILFITTTNVFWCIRRLSHEEREREGERERGRECVFVLWHDCIYSFLIWNELSLMKKSHFSFPSSCLQKTYRTFEQEIIKTEKLFWEIVRRNPIFVFIWRGGCVPLDAFWRQFISYKTERKSIAHRKHTHCSYVVPSRKVEQYTWREIKHLIRFLNSSQASINDDKRNRWLDKGSNWYHWNSPPTPESWCISLSRPSWNRSCHFAWFVCSCRTLPPN